MNECPVLTRHRLENLLFNLRKKKLHQQTNVYASSEQSEDCVTVLVCRKVRIPDSPTKTKIHLQQNANFTILRINYQNYR